VLDVKKERTSVPQFNSSARETSRKNKEKLFKLMASSLITGEVLAEKFGLPLDAIHVVEGLKNTKY
jgi:hypothetical protein